MKKITRFRGEYHFLSNFSPSPIWVFHVRFPTAEHLFQCLKVPIVELDFEHMKLMAELPTPLEAKSVGRKLPLWAGWEEGKVGIMRLVVESKFRQNPDLADRLRATGDAKLIEGNSWGDDFWGMVPTEKGGSTLRGKNHLGKVLMETRKGLK